MGIAQIREINLYELVESRSPEKPKELAPKGKKCIYDKTQECTIPNCKMKMCQTCPYGMMYTAKHARKSLFDKIIAMAIFLMGKRPVISSVSGASISPKK